MLKTLKHYLRPIHWQKWTHKRQLFSRRVDHMSPEEFEEFLKEFDAKGIPLTTRFLRLTTRRICQQADWWGVATSLISCAPQPPLSFHGPTPVTADFVREAPVQRPRHLAGFSTPVYFPDCTGRTPRTGDRPAA